MSSVEEDAGNRFRLLQNQIKILTEEIRNQEETYEKRKARIEDSSKAIHADHQKKSEVLQRKLSALMEEAKWNQKTYFTELNDLKEAIKQHEATHTKQVDMLKNELAEEKEGRAAFAIQVEEQLKANSCEVEELHGLVLQQGKEIQNILVTLHVQFEHFMGNLKEHSKELETAREEQDTVNKTVDGCLQALGNVLNETNKNVHQNKEQAIKSIQSAVEVEAKERKKLEEAMTASLKSNHTEFVTKSKKQASDYERMDQELKKISSQQSDSQDTLKKTKMRVVEMEFDIRNAQKDVTAAFTDALQKQREDIRKEARKEKETWKAETTKLEKCIEEHSDKIEKIHSEVAAANEKCDNIGHTALMAELNWEKKLDIVEAQVKQQKSDLNASVEKFNLDRSKQKFKEDEWSTRLNAMSKQIYEQMANQNIVNDHVQEKLDDHDQGLKSTNEVVETSEQQLKELLTSFQEQTEEFDSLKQDLKDTKHEHFAHKNEFKRKMLDYSDLLEATTQRLKHQIEGQVLANQDFKVKQLKQEEALESLSERLDSWASQLEQVKLNQTTSERNTGANLPTKDLVDHVNCLAEELKTMRKELKTARRESDDMQKNFDKDHKTWENLFQHLVVQLRQQESNVATTKLEQEKISKDLNDSLALFETQVRGATSRKPAKAHSLSVEELQMKMEKSHNELYGLVFKMQNEIIRQRTAQESIAIAQSEQEEGVELELSAVGSEPIQTQSINKVNHDQKRGAVTKRVAFFDSEGEEMRDSEAAISSGSPAAERE